MTLREGSQQVAVQLRGKLRISPMQDSSLLQSGGSAVARVSADDEAPIVDVASSSESSESIPKGIDSWCTLSKTTERPRFHERALVPGIRIALSLCREGDELRRCGRSGDFMSADGPRSVAALYQQHALGGLFALLGVSSLDPTPLPSPIVPKWDLASR
jgi:hypothetical protein